MRLSQTNEDCQRASNYQSSSSDRPQTAVRLKGRFPKSARLKTRPEFRKVQREGRRIQGALLVFLITSENFTCPRLGITVSKKFGPAVARNLFKRRVRETFRLKSPQLPRGLVIHVAPRPNIIMPTFAQIQEDFRECFESQFQSLFGTF